MPKDEVEKINVTPAPAAVPEGEVFVAPARIYADADGNPVSADDPNRKTVLVGQGAEVPMDKAREMGIVDMPAPVDRDTEADADAPKADTVVDEDNEADVNDAPKSRKAVGGPPANKAQAAPKGTK